MSNEFLSKFERLPIFKKLTPEWISIIGEAGSERRQRKPEGLKSEHRDCGWFGGNSACSCESKRVDEPERLP